MVLLGEEGQKWQVKGPFAYPEYKLNTIHLYSGLGAPPF